MKKSILSLVLAGLFSTGAVASDGTVTINGEIVDKTCTITGTSGKNVDVTLPTVNKVALSSDGMTAGTTPFKIVLSGCPQSAVFKANFDGSNVLTSGLLNNTTFTGAATNVGVQMLNDSQVPINLSTQANTTVVTTNTNGDGVLNYYAQYIAIGGAASTGTVKTNVQYSIVYP